MPNLTKMSILNQFIGQTKLKNICNIMIESSILRKETLDHILFYASAGMGKTTLANLIAQKLGVEVRYAQGSMITNNAEILILLTAISSGTIIFIDEIHSLKPKLAEILYLAMEKFVIDIKVGQDLDSKMVRMKIPRFTLIGATTHLEKIARPFQDRFGLIATFDNYDLNQIKQIVDLNVQKSKLKIEDDALWEIANHSQQNPRIALNLLKRIIDLATIEKTQIIDQKLIQKTFSKIGVFKNGLNKYQITYLQILKNNFQEKWIALNSLIYLLGKNSNYISDFIEPLLLSLNLIERSTKGRKITNKGKKYLNLLKD